MACLSRSDRPDILTLWDHDTLHKRANEEPHRAKSSSEEVRLRLLRAREELVVWDLLTEADLDQPIRKAISKDDDMVDNLPPYRHQEAFLF